MISMISSVASNPAYFKKREQRHSTDASPLLYEEGLAGVLPCSTIANSQGYVQLSFMSSSGLPAS